MVTAPEGAVTIVMSIYQITLIENVHLSISVL